MSFKQQLQERFPDSSVQTVSESEKFNLLQFTFPYFKKKYTIICTEGLSDYAMPVTHKYEGSEHIELCFCCESDWDLTDPNYSWVFDKLDWLGAFLLERKTWFGVGHTIPNGKPPVALSKVFTQTHFFFDEATVFTKEFAPISTKEKDIHFLFVIPISKIELDFKQKKTTFGFKKRMKKRGLSEILEDFRVDIADNGWFRFFKRN